MRSANYLLARTSVVTPAGFVALAPLGPGGLGPAYVTPTVHRSGGLRSNEQKTYSDS